MTTDLTPVQIARLWAYLNNHGRILLLANPISGKRGDALPVDGALFNLMWTNMTLRARNDLVMTTDPAGAVSRIRCAGCLGGKSSTTCGAASWHPR